MRNRSKVQAKQRLTRMEGQVRGLIGMVEDERECVDILTQVAALRAGLESFGSLVLSEHVEELMSPIADSKIAEQSVYERVEGVRAAIGRLIK